MGAPVLVSESTWRTDAHRCQGHLDEASVTRFTRTTVGQTIEHAARSHLRRMSGPKWLRLTFNNGEVIDLNAAAISAYYPSPTDPPYTAIHVSGCSDGWIVKESQDDIRRQIDMLYDA